MPIIAKAKKPTFLDKKHQKIQNLKQAKFQRVFLEDFSSEITNITSDARNYITTPGGFFYKFHNKKNLMRIGQMIPL